MYERLRRELDKKLEEQGLQDRVKQVLLKQSMDLDAKYADVLATATKTKSKTPLKKQNLEVAARLYSAGPKTKKPRK